MHRDRKSDCGPSRNASKSSVNVAVKNRIAAKNGKHGQGKGARALFCVSRSSLGTWQRHVCCLSAKDRKKLVKTVKTHSSQQRTLHIVKTACSFQHRSLQIRGLRHLSKVAQGGDFIPILEELVQLLQPHLGAAQPLSALNIAKDHAHQHGTSKHPMLHNDCVRRSVAGSGCYLELDHALVISCVRWNAIDPSEQSQTCADRKQTSPGTTKCIVSSRYCTVSSDRSEPTLRCSVRRRALTSPERRIVDSSERTLARNSTIGKRHLIPRKQPRAVKAPSKVVT
eukprot:3933178-Rhodomonas_salina.1